MPGALAVGDRVANQAEVVAQQRDGEALHELRRLSQLHLEHDREVAIAAEAREVRAGEAAEPLARIVEVGDRGAAVRRAPSRMLRSKIETSRSSLLLK